MEHSSFPVLGLGGGGEGGQGSIQWLLNLDVQTNAPGDFINLVSWTPLEGILI